jgi:hypothetical protein
MAEGIRRRRRTLAADAARATAERAWAASLAASQGPPRWPILDTFLHAGLRDETRRLVQPNGNPLAGQLARLAVMADHDLDAAVEGIIRIAESLGGGGPHNGRVRVRRRGAIALAEVQADTMVDVVEAAFTDLGLRPEQVLRARTLLAVRFREVAELQDRAGQA